MGFCGFGMSGVMIVISRVLIFMGIHRWRINGVVYLKESRDHPLHSSKGFYKIFIPRDLD